MTAPGLSPAKQRFGDALRFSTALNEMLSAFFIPSRLPPEQAHLIMRQNHTFMLLVTVGAFDAFTTGRCQELRLRPTDSRTAKPTSPLRALFQDKLRALRPLGIAQASWEDRVDDAHELYYKARTLWIHGAGLPSAVRGAPRDLSVFDQDQDGRCWVSQRLWSGCVKALEGLADDCR